MKHSSNNTKLGNDEGQKCKYYLIENFTYHYTLLEYNGFVLSQIPFVNTLVKRTS